MIEDIYEVFDQYNDEYLEFEHITEHKPYTSKDMCAFHRLYQLVDIKGNIIDAANHYIMYLNVDVDELAKKASVEDILYLIRCGIHIDEDNNSLAKFV